MDDPRAKRTRLDPALLTPTTPQYSNKAQSIDNLVLDFHERTIHSALKNIIDKSKAGSTFSVTSLSILVTGSQDGRPHSCRSSIRTKGELLYRLSVLQRFKVDRLFIFDDAHQEQNQEETDCPVLRILHCFVRRISLESVTYLDTDVPYFDRIFLDRRGSFLFPCLKTFSAPKKRLSSDFGVSVLQSSELKEFLHPVRARDLQAFLESNNTHVLKYCDFGRAGDLEELNRVAEGKPELCEMTLYGATVSNDLEDFDTLSGLKFIATLKDLFRSSCASLVKLCTNLPILIAVTHNCDSRMVQLKSIHLEYEKDHFHLLNHISFENFPKLLEVTFRSSIKDPTVSQGTIPKIFLEHSHVTLNPSPSVEAVSLNLKSQSSDREVIFEADQLDLLARAFPSVKYFAVLKSVGPKQESVFLDFIERIMKLPWRGLTELEIHSNLDLHYIRPYVLGISNAEYLYWIQKYRVIDTDRIVYAPLFNSVRNFPELCKKNIILGSWLHAEP